MIDEKIVKDDFKEMLVEQKGIAESYVALSIYKNTDLYFDSNLKVEDFSDNSPWKFYFAIAEKAIKSGKKVLDDIVMGLVVSENSALQSMYDKFGGYETISQGVTFVQEENFSSYLSEVKKLNALLRLEILGYPIKENFDTYKVMSADAIQEALEGALHSIFADIDVDEPVEDLKEGLWKMVMKAHEGVNRGFPYHSALLNDWVNGQALGNITMLSANSGMGKTFLTIAQILPNMIEFKEKLLIICNEEDKAKWQQALVTWAINNIIKDGNFNKQRFFQGNFTDDEMTMLRAGVDWLEEQMDEGIIQFINFNSFSMKKTIKTMKKVHSLYGTKYFIIDTLKLDSDAIDANVQAWLSLMTNMVDLYNLVKPSNLNLHAFVTFQLGKSAMMNRFLSQADLGMSRNVVDVVSTLLLARRANNSEKDGGTNELKVKTKNGYQKMDKDKDYFIIFLGKNRMGGTHRQLVLEVDIARNIVKDFGTVVIEQDF